MLPLNSLLLRGVAAASLTGPTAPPEQPNTTIMLKQPLYILLSLLVLGFTSCADEEFDPVLSLGDAPELSVMSDVGTTFIIEDSLLDATMATFSWTAGEFGVPVGATYTLQADLASNNFSEPIALAPANSATMATVTYRPVNNFLLSRGVEPGTAADIQVRVIARVGRADDGNSLTSEAVTLTVTPFEAEVELPVFYVPGAYQSPMWSPGGADVGRLYSQNDDGFYEGYVNFGPDGSEYKFTPEPDWNESYGDVDGDGMLDNEPDNNIQSTATGYHRIQLNFNELTYTQTPTEWGLIGSATATGWDSDTDFTVDPETNLLTILAQLGAGEEMEFKFRANDAWDINFGDNDGDGSLEYNGGNLSVDEAGMYLITLDLTGPTPTYSLERQ